MTGERDAAAGEEGALRRGFRSTSAGGLDRESFPARLWAKSKRLGTWDPSGLDFTPDAEQWATLAADEQDLLLRLSALFQAGEEAVTLDLLPQIRVVADEGRLEEEMYLAAFLWEEAKHVDAFRRFFEEVARHDGDLSGYHTPAYRRLFHRELPAAMRRLEEDRSPAAQAEAAVVYHMIVEGVLAETGYHAYREMLEEQDLLPATRQMLTLVQRDESRHLAYGVWLISRLVAEHGDTVWSAVEGRMGELLEVALTMIRELFDCYDPVPFGLELDAFVAYATDQFARRMDRIEAARGRDPSELAADPPPASGGG